MNRHALSSLAICLTLGFMACGTAIGQESTTSKDTRSGVAEGHIADKINSTVNDFDSEIETSCSGHAIGEEWNESCTGGLVGQVTKVCVSGGIEALKASNCVAPPKNCDGGHSHGSTWTGSCDNPLLSGTITYQCNDGNISVLSMACTANYQCLDGSSYSGSCPSGTTGTVTYSCTNNTLAAVSNTCAVVNNACGTHPHGSTWQTACPAGTSGSVTNQCFNGTTGVVAMNCVAPANGCGSHADGESWDSACGDGTYTSKCFDGEVGITAVNCRTMGGAVTNIAGPVSHQWGARIAAAIKAGPTCSAPAPTRTGSIASVSDDDAYTVYTTCRIFSGSTCTSQGMTYVGGSYTAQQRSDFVTYFATTAWQDYYYVQSKSGCYLGVTQFAWRADFASTICTAAGYGAVQSTSWQQYSSPGNNQLVWAIGPQAFGIYPASNYNYYFTSLVCRKTAPLIFDLSVGN